MSCRDAFDTIVQIRVGPDKQLFSMHKKLVCDTSGFFRAALCGNFQESETQAIEMPEDDPEVFCYFQYWAYTGVIEHKPRGHFETPWHTVFGVYIFGEARCIPRLQNSAIDVLISKHEVSPRAPIDHYRHVYENTSDKSPVRKFLAEWAAYRGVLSKDWFHDRTIYPIDFTIDLSLALYERINEDTPLGLDFWELRSRYYVEVDSVSSSEGRNVWL